ncbi:hypothetical protein BRAO285_1270033 [Bradyrhizobium sp. ORS 285]|nr:hypothetical protein BRAO285_1270033 [Bradyrhizobium sp. ORS 285]
MWYENRVLERDNGFFSPKFVCSFPMMMAHINRLILASDVLPCDMPSAESCRDNGSRQCLQAPSP